MRRVLRGAEFDPAGVEGNVIADGNDTLKLVLAGTGFRAVAKITIINRASRSICPISSSADLSSAGLTASRAAFGIAFMRRLRRAS